MPDRRPVNKPLLAVVGVGAIAVTGWVGANAWIGGALERELAAAVERARTEGLVRIDDFSHARGLFGSQGSAVLVSNAEACGPETADGAPLPPPRRFAVRWTVRHLGLGFDSPYVVEMDVPKAEAAAAGNAATPAPPSGPAAPATPANPAEPDAADRAPAILRAADGGTLLARIEGARSLGGTDRYALRSAGVEIVDPDGSALRTGAAEGSFRGRGAALDGELRIASIRIEPAPDPDAPGAAGAAGVAGGGAGTGAAAPGRVETGPIVATFAYTDLARSVGTIKAGVDRIVTGTGGIERMDVESSAAIEDGRYVGSGRFAARGIVAGDRRLDTVEGTTRLGGIDAAALQRVQQLALATCFFAKADDAQKAEAKKLGAKLLSEGFVLSMPSMAAKGPDGTATMRFELAARPAPEDAKAGRIDFARGLHASGEITVSGPAMTPEARASLVEQGLAVERGDALASSFEFTPQGLVLNGKPSLSVALPALIARYALHQGDLKLAEWLGTPPPAPMEAPPGASVLGALGGAGSADDEAAGDEEDEASAEEAPPPKPRPRGR